MDSIKQWAVSGVIVLVVLTCFVFQDSLQYAMFKRSRHLVTLNPATLQLFQTEDVGSDGKGGHKKLYVYKNERGEWLGIEGAPVEAEGAYETRASLDFDLHPTHTHIYERVQWGKFIASKIFMLLIAVVVLLLMVLKSWKSARIA